jgi:hypothetical protein
MDATTLRIVCVAVVLVFGTLIFMRRRNKKPE